MKVKINFSTSLRKIASAILWQSIEYSAKAYNVTDCRVAYAPRNDATVLNNTRHYERSEVIYRTFSFCLQCNRLPRSTAFRSQWPEFPRLCEEGAETLVPDLSGRLTRQTVEFLAFAYNVTDCRAHYVRSQRRRCNRLLRRFAPRNDKSFFIHHS